MDNFKNMNVLVVDDEPQLRAGVAFELEMLGLKVLEAPDGEGALAVVAKTPVHLVLSDIRMPRMDGVKLLGAIRSTYGIRPPLVFMTGFADIPLWEAYHRGAQGILGKPFRPEELTHLIEKLLRPAENRWQAQGLQPKRSIVASFTPDEGAANAFRVGLGGFFLGKKFEGVRRGELVAFNVSVADQPQQSLEGIGIVRWVRSAADALGGGCGIEFEYLTPDSRSFVLNGQRDSKDVTYIPQS